MNFVDPEEQYEQQQITDELTEKVNVASALANQKLNEIFQANLLQSVDPTEAAELRESTEALFASLSEKIAAIYKPPPPKTPEERHKIDILAELQAKLDYENSQLESQKKDLQQTADILARYQKTLNSQQAEFTKEVMSLRNQLRVKSKQQDGQEQKVIETVDVGEWLARTLNPKGDNEDPDSIIHPKDEIDVLRKKVRKGLDRKDKEHDFEINNLEKKVEQMKADIAALDHLVKDAQINMDE